MTLNTEEEKIAYTQANIEYIYEHDGLHINVDKDPATGELFIKKPLSFEIGKYPTEFECATCGSIEKLDNMYYNHYTKTHICKHCFNKFKREKYADYVASARDKIKY